MPIKKWKVTINVLFGLKTVVTFVSANTHRKARIIALEKVKKQEKANFATVISCEQMLNVNSNN